MNCRLQDEVQSMCEGAEAWCAGNRKFWAAAVGQMLPPAATDQSLHRIPSKYSLAPSPRGKQGAQQAG